MAKDFNRKAEKKVQGALGVFDRAINEVSAAQDLLAEGVKQDIAAIAIHRKQIRDAEAKHAKAVADLESKIAAVEESKLKKGELMENNAHLLRNLKQFKA